ncbi:MAG TPA: 16S rRNA (guanine(966)-N(2))-methyltransferase RsmD [bacterium]|nr:16S rRNA (guanine(966)-N(2))-methyltransferase RsmD [bacterium]
MTIRIIGGESRGRKLKGPRGLEFRPATGRAKTFIFSYLSDRIKDAVVLDLFAGSGSLGLEALSQGAAHVDFVEKSFQHIQLLKSNISRCDFSDRSRIIHGDVFEEIIRLRNSHRRFSLILADPPFKAFYRERIVRSVKEGGILKSDGILIIEHDSHDPDSEGHGFRLIRQKPLGQSYISIYHRGEK